MCVDKRDNLLIVPPGHPKAGERFEIPEYWPRFSHDALRVDTHEAALIIASKNAQEFGRGGAAAGLLSWADLRACNRLEYVGWRFFVAREGA